jgi:uncharacterized membrane protein YcfT
MQTIGKGVEASDSQKSTAEYLPWVDVAKAAAIILVVLFHSRYTTWFVGFTNDDFADDFWGYAGEALTPLRMPVFFVVSGMLAASAVHREWARVSTKRVWSSLYVYVVWAVIYMLLIPAWPHLTESGFSLWQQIGMIVIGDTSAWYLWALVVFFVIARLTKNVGTYAVLGIAFAIAMVAPEFRDALHHPPRLMMQCAFFFLLGARVPQLPVKVAASATVWRLGMSSVALIVLLLAHLKHVPGVYPFAGCAAVIWAIMASSLAVRHFELARRWGGWLGTRTLPVYVLHFVVLTVVINVARSTLPDFMLSSALVALVAPLVLAIAVFAISLGLAVALPRIGLAWLFALPRKLSA